MVHLMRGWVGLGMSLCVLSVQAEEIELASPALVTPKAIGACSVVVGATVDLAVGAGGTLSGPYATASCGKAAYMTGGTCQVTDAAGIQSVYSGPAFAAGTNTPASARTWACYYRNGSTAPAVLRAVAICCN